MVVSSVSSTVRSSCQYQFAFDWFAWHRPANRTTSNRFLQSVTTCPCSLMSLTSKLLVDIHTHVYLPRYTALLRSRTSVPFIRSISTPEGATDDRLLILDHEPSGGRPVGPQYWEREGERTFASIESKLIFISEKLKFMDKHGIDVSIVRYVHNRFARSNLLTELQSAQRTPGWTFFQLHKHKLLRPS